MVYHKLKYLFVFIKNTYYENYLKTKIIFFLLVTSAEDDKFKKSILFL